MANMKYFRRPTIAGKNLPREQYAKIRGSIRRSDPDGTSSVPYFPTITAGVDNLIVTHQGGTDNVTLSGTSFTSIISDLNTALGSDALAQDVGGCLVLKSKVIGGGGYVSVTGGTAAPKLGLDTTYLGTIESKGGDVPSAPEGRVNNPFGASFSNSTDNLDVTAINAALGRVAGNLDVVYSDLMKSDVVLKKLATISSWTTVDKNFCHFTATGRVYNGLGRLTNASSKEDIAPYFFLVEVGGGVATGRVVAVTNGAPVTTVLPIANTASWSAADGGNILGQDLAKTTKAITSIFDGRVLEASTGTFVTNGVEVGDYAQITGATNLDEWDNNGYKWVVEEVISETKLALRPMSSAELAVVSTTLTDVQPVLELSTKLTGGQTYGDVVVTSGTFWDNPYFLVSPALPLGQNYELWAAIPSNKREEELGLSATSLTPLTKPFVADWAAAPSGLLQAPNPTAGAGLVLNYTLGYARWKGRIIKIPASSLTLVDNTTNYVYWDEDTGSVLSSTSASDVFNVQSTDPTVAAALTSDRGHLIARVVTAAAAISTIYKAQKVLSDFNPSLTVGPGGDFNDLTTAAEFINQWATNGPTKRWELVITGMLPTLTANVTFSTSAIHIRGVAAAGSTVTAGIDVDTFYLEFASGCDILVENLNLSSGSAAASFTAFYCINGSITCRNLRMDTADTELGYLVFASNTRVLVEDCFLVLGAGLVRGSGSVYALNSTFYGTSTSAVAAQFISDDTQDDPYSGDEVVIANNQFTNSWGTSLNHLIIVGNNQKVLTIQNNYFVLNGLTSSQYIADLPAGAVVSGNHFDSLAYFTSLNSTHTVSNNYFAGDTSATGRFLSNYCVGNVVAGNNSVTVTNNVMSNLTITTNGTHISVCNNRMSNLSITATGLTSVRINGNHMGSVTLTGVGSAYINGIVMGNIIYNIASYGISLDYVSILHIVSNYITGGTGATPCISISSNNNVYIYIDNNSISDLSTTSAIDVVNCNTGRIAMNVISKSTAGDHINLTSDARMMLIALNHYIGKDAPTVADANALTDDQDNFYMDPSATKSAGAYIYSGGIRQNV